MTTKTQAKPRHYNVIKSSSVGNDTLAVVMPFREFYDQSIVANNATVGGGKGPGSQTAQRDLFFNHSREISLYVLRGAIKRAMSVQRDKDSEASRWLAKYIEFLGPKSYVALPPLVAQIRGAKKHQFGLSEPVKSGSTYRITLRPNQKLYVLDGQHRRHGVESLYRWVQKILNDKAYAKGLNYIPDPEIRGASFESGEIKAWQAIYDVLNLDNDVVVEIHIGLDIVQERQFFHDLNNRVLKIDSQTTLAYDSANPTVAFVREELTARKGFKNLNLREDQTRISWIHDGGDVAFALAVRTSSILFRGNTQSHKAMPLDIQLKRELVLDFWKMIVAIPAFGQGKALSKTVAAQPVMLQGMARAVYWVISNEGVNEGRKFIDALHKINYKQSNNLWQWSLLSVAGRKKAYPGLEKYLNLESQLYYGWGYYDQRRGIMNMGHPGLDRINVIANFLLYKTGKPPQIRNKTKKK